ncbi:MAG: hypothetical protein ABIY70_06795 [Capsulimonas sp.]|uniref:hypothetical protein n=1 Tax=Capsulimonas sp. TaxID=2494211 RepID=UPI003262FBA1
MPSKLQWKRQSAMLDRRLEIEVWQRDADLMGMADEDTVGYGIGILGDCSHKENGMRRSWWANFAGMMAILAMVAAHGAWAEDAAAGQEPKHVKVSVDYLEVDPGIYAKALKDIPAGAKHDGLLLAALLKDGVKPVMSPRLTTADGVAGHVDTSQQIHYKSDDGKDETMTAMSGIDATPHCQPNGRIACDLKVVRQFFVVHSTSSRPSVTTRSLSAVPTVADGEVYELAGMEPAAAWSEKMSLIFLKVSMVADKP